MKPLNSDRSLWNAATPRQVGGRLGHDGPVERAKHAAGFLVAAGTGVMGL